jgi:hypothetical protein
MTTQLYVCLCCILHTKNHIKGVLANVLAYVCVTIDGVLDWILDLLTTSSPACCLFTSRSLATASNSGDSSASRARFYLHNLPYGTQLKCQLTLSLAYNILTRATYKTRRFHCCSSTVALQVLSICCLVTGAHLPSRCPETVSVYRVTA